MPVIEIDGQLHEFPDDFTDADIAAALGGGEAAPEQESDGSGIPGASASVGALRAAGAVAPAAGRGVARFAANHPVGTQKAIGAGMTALASGVGAGVGSMFGPVGTLAGAVSGGAVRGMTPTQQAIREWAGRGMGETADVAKAAGRAQGIQEYIKNTSGYKVNPAHILERANGLPAAENYAKSQGRELLKVLGADGRVAAGPTADVAQKAPGVAGRLVTKGAGAAKTGLGVASKALSAVSGPMAMTDLAQTIEPNRRDIGVMGIGASQPDPTAEQTQQIDTQNKQAMEQRLAAQAQQWQQVRAAILQRLGMQ